MKFPDSTYFNRKLPKQRFYENLTVSAATKKSFVDQIKSIYWENIGRHNKHCSRKYGNGDRDISYQFESRYNR